MPSLANWTLAASLLCASACGSPEVATPQPVHKDTRDEKTPNQAVVAWLKTDPSEAIWLAEQQAPWPQIAGDRDPGVRQIVRQAAMGEPAVLWRAAAHERITAALASPDGTWAAVGVDGDRRPFLSRGDQQGLRSQQIVEDPGLVADPSAWIGSEPPAYLRLGLLSEDSVRIAGTVDDPVLTLVSEHSAVLAYRFHWSGARFELSTRTLVSPAMAQTPYLPIGASYDNFDAVVHDFGARVASLPSGAAYVALPMSSARMRVHNRIFGTAFQPLRSDDDLLNRPSDLLVTRLASDGSIAWSRLIGVADVDDEVYAIATGPSEQLALVGRTRRERGRDNSEWHIGLHGVTADGRATYSQTVDVPGCGIAQAAAFRADGSLLVGGSADWLQNPSGISLYREGKPLLLQVDFDGQGQPRPPSVLADLLPDTTGHAELRAIAVESGRLWLGGLENGPLTHTGDHDRSLIRADGWRRSIPLP